MRTTYLFLLTTFLFLGCQGETNNTAAEANTANEMDEAFLPENIADDQFFDWQAHRGGRGLMPENTVAAFDRALEFPEVTTLELDLVVSRDQRLVVSHEPWMSAEICRDADGRDIDKASERKLNIYEMRYGDIFKYDCGSKGNERFPEQEKRTARKPRLADVVSIVDYHMKRHKREPVYYNIEMKTTSEGDNIFHPTPEKFAELLVAELNELNIKELSTVQSFDPRSLRAIKALDESIVTALLIENEQSLDQNIENLGYTPEIYSPYHELVTPDLIEKAHRKNMRVIPWTVNDTTRMQQLIDMDVDGIITDYPNLIAKVGE